MSNTLVPDDFVVPLDLRTDRFRLEPLGPEHNERDHEAWMSSIAHIQATPGFAGGRTGRGRCRLEQNLADLVRHAADFAARTGVHLFGARRRRGDRVRSTCTRPTTASTTSRRPSWVRASRAELDVVLWETVSAWLAGSWPFQRPLVRATPARSERRSRTRSSSTRSTSTSTTVRRRRARITRSYSSQSSWVPPGGGEHLAQQEPQPLRRRCIEMRVVGTDQLRRALRGRPPPTRPGSPLRSTDRRAGRRAGGRSHPTRTRRPAAPAVGCDITPGVDDARARRTVGPPSHHDRQTVIERHELGEAGQIGHDASSAADGAYTANPSAPWTSRRPYVAATRQISSSYPSSSRRTSSPTAMRSGSTSHT